MTDEKVLVLVLVLGLGACGGAEGFISVRLGK